jgi:hypothetical protein
MELKQSSLITWSQDFIHGAVFNMPSAVPAQIYLLLVQRPHALDIKGTM